METREKLTIIILTVTIIILSIVLFSYILNTNRKIDKKISSLIAVEQTDKDNIRMMSKDIYDKDLQIKKLEKLLSLKNTTICDLIDEKQHLENQISELEDKQENETFSLYYDLVDCINSTNIIKSPLKYYVGSLISDTVLTEEEEDKIKHYLSKKGNLFIIRNKKLVNVKKKN